MSTKHLNLNLLRALYALLSCRHVTLASKQIGVSQSSMSISLKQLREFYNDSLLVPGRHNIMQLTPLAASLIEPTRNAMSQIDTIFSCHQPFNPATDTRTFRIGMSDLVSYLLAPNLIHKIEEVAPDIKVNIVHPRYLTSSDVFESGELDVMVGMFEGAPGGLKHQALFHDEAVIVGCKDHPGFENGTISMENILKYPLIQLSLSGTPFHNYFDRYLAKLGYAKRVSISVGHGLVPLITLPGTNYLTLTIRSAAEKLNSYLHLSIAPVPFPIDIYSCYQYWHQKDNEDPAHQWIRSLIKDVAKQAKSSKRPGVN
ncbi:LysR family transcriptional regulator [Legionella bononiensis]|uniref:LysR family transcriptional regulator n=1 Tax=Legionella bononiensis TaxID=2793102 RepID=A0ABS1WBY9_9GAMM|nr:LysR family transcriptional regulator [Legionella bononiensis]MBL7481150.1 LysR family transcriptional regulator [Legionella bononiensis]MBL7526859.1 LysR family transcriptional regulator [Legionella bononiensis]MBL7564266.1 LysR family transcriptional regulator [Legionella bononiensis]